MTVVTERGRCFEFAISQAAELHRAGARVLICHGTPVGTGGEVEGKRYWHAWVEVKIDGAWYAMDISLPGTAVPRATMYEAGQITPRLHVWRFTPAQAHKEIETRGHAGPWVDDYESFTEL